MKILGFLRERKKEERVDKKIARARRENIVISVSRLSTYFETRMGIDNINLDIKYGDLVGIVGGSGAGKTILGKHLIGLEYSEEIAREGTVILYGKDLDRISERELDSIRRRIGYVPQTNALWSSLNIYGNLTLALRENPDKKYKESELKEIAEDVLKRVNLKTEYLPRMTDQISGGEKKRVAIARALAINPEIIVYDEPTSGLDPKTTKSIADLIVKLHEQANNTSIVITHEPRLMEMMERIVFLKSGQKYFDGNWKDFEGSKDSEICSFLANENNLILHS